MSSAFDSLKITQSKGFYCIPVCTMFDARESLLDPMAALFLEIYNTAGTVENFKNNTYLKEGKQK